MGVEHVELRLAAQTWLDEFAAALAARSEDELRDLFASDGYWRDLIALSGSIQTLEGRGNVAAGLTSLVEGGSATNFAIAAERTAPSLQLRGGREVLETFFEFETELFRCKGVFRLSSDESESLRPCAVALMTSVHELKGHEEPIENRRPDLKTSYSWDFETEEPDVLIVGGGQSGLCLAARLRMMGVPTLVVEKNERVGNNWRSRYSSLKLHNIIQVNRFPFLPFPSNYPTYLPKDLYGDWLETYANLMDIEVWTETKFLGGGYDEKHSRWAVRVESPSGDTKELHPCHVVLATGGFAGMPNIPELPGLSEFAGTTAHTTQVRSGREFAGQKVVVVGTGTSGHDLAVELLDSGCEVSMVQRSACDVLSQEAANLYQQLFVERPAEEVDLIAAAFSKNALRAGFQELTQGTVAEMDSELRENLESVGFRTSLGVDDAGHFWDFLVKGGGYYIDVGASQRIIDGTIRIHQTEDVERYGPDGVYLRDGSIVPADAVLLATGFVPQEVEIEQLFGRDIAEKVGPIWGYGEDGEIRNAWVPTGRQDGLWLMNGGIQHARDYSRYVAIQIKLRLLDVRVGVRNVASTS